MALPRCSPLRTAALIEDLGCLWRVFLSGVHFQFLKACLLSVNGFLLVPNTGKEKMFHTGGEIVPTWVRNLDCSEFHCNILIDSGWPPRCKIGAGAWSQAQNGKHGTTVSSVYCHSQLVTLQQLKHEDKHRTE